MSRCAFLSGRTALLFHPTRVVESAGVLGAKHGDLILEGHRSGAVARDSSTRALLGARGVELGFQALEEGLNLVVGTLDLLHQRVEGFRQDAQLAVLEHVAALVFGLPGKQPESPLTSLCVLEDCDGLLDFQVCLRHATPSPSVKTAFRWAEAPHALRGSIVFVIWDGPWSRPRRRVMKSP